MFAESFLVSDAQDLCPCLQPRPKEENSHPHLCGWAIALSSWSCPLPSDSGNKLSADRWGTQTVMTAHFFFPPELQLTAFVIFFALQHFGTGLLRLTDQQKLQAAGLLSHKSCLSHVRLRWDPPRVESRALPYSQMNTLTQTYHTPYYYPQ